jgi:glycerol-3-phosphate acyltransferase PlsY
MNTLIISLVLIFMVGGIPFGLIIGKVFGKIDIRTQGSGNIGASNVGRLIGKKYAVLTFLLDGLKSFIPVFIIKKLFGIDIAICATFFSVIGHMYSIWLKGKGGKGISSTMMAILAVDYRIFIAMGLTWILFFKLTKISAIGSLSSVSVMLLCSYFLFNRFCFNVLFLLTLVIFFAHRTNIKRIMGNRELKFDK